MCCPPPFPPQKKHNQPKLPPKKLRFTTIYRHRPTRVHPKILDNLIFLLENIAYYDRGPVNFAENHRFKPKKKNTQIYERHFRPSPTYITTEHIT